MQLIKVNFQLIIVLLIALTGCSTNQQQVKNTTEKKIRIYAAAGSRLATEELCNSFESSTNIHIERNYASSGVLARQIANGAQCDLFISANKQWIDFLVKKDLLDTLSISKIACNSLVIIAPLDSKLDIQKFSSKFNILPAAPNKITIGDPNYVPAGKYAKMVLDSLKCYHNLESRIIMAKDVTSVLHYVELGECDWGIVYKSTAQQSDKVKTIMEIPPNLHQPISFYLAAINNKHSYNKDLLHSFNSDAGQIVFEKYGFTSTKP